MLPPKLEIFIPKITTNKIEIQTANVGFSTTASLIKMFPGDSDNA